MKARISPAELHLAVSLFILKQRVGIIHSSIFHVGIIIRLNWALWMKWLDC